MREGLSINSKEIINILGTVGSPLIVISELIKNSVDAEATRIQIFYDTKQKQIQISDNGIGMTEAEIRRLAQPGVSYKKIDGNVRNKNGFYFTGSKGLGILSCFSLCDSFSIYTATADKEELYAEFSRNGELELDIINEKVNLGTTIILKEVSKENIDFLTSQFELRKLRHLSTYLFKNKAIIFPEIILKINDAEPQSILFQTDFKGMLYDVKFYYNKVNQSISFKTFSELIPEINTKSIELNLLTNGLWCVSQHLIS